MGHEARRLVTVALAGALAAGFARAARAEPEPVPAFEPGRTVVRLAGELGEPNSSLALDGWIDLNDRFRLGLTSSDDARRLLAAGRGLCLTRCGPAVTGLALEAQARFSATLVGRAALDTTMLSPTIAALELGLDSYHGSGPLLLTVSPVLRLGIERRDLVKVRDSGAVLVQLAARAWPGGGVAAFAHLAVDVDAPDDDPSFGAAAGAWQTVAGAMFSVRAGAADVSSARATRFAEVAIAWAR